MPDLLLLEPVVYGTAAAFSYCTLMGQPLFPPGFKNFAWRMYESLIHINILYLFMHAATTYWIRFEETDWPVLQCILYYAMFEAMYIPFHALQHDVPFLRKLHAEHHSLELYPAYAFAADPLDFIFIHTSAQLPAVVLQPSRGVYNTMIGLLTFMGIMAHSPRGWVGAHIRHHNFPHQGRYSFTGLIDECLDFIHVFVN